MNITAKLNDYRQSPRKVRLVAGLIRGKKAEQAIDILNVTVKRASDPMIDLLKSAIANAKNNFSLNAEDLFVKSLTVDNGAILYRRMPKARGMATPIRKRVSHISLVLGVKESEVKNLPKGKAEVKAPSKKKASKK
jgi:large subunit ribosomal protein L22